MERYLGLDPHTKSCSFAVVSEQGKVVRRDVVETNGQALVGYVEQLAGRLHLAIEEGEWSQWLFEILAPRVAEAVVIHGRKRRGSKSDTLDAEDLAQRLRTGQTGRPIYKAPHRFAKLRHLARVYTLMSRDVARTKNRLKSLFRRRGIPCSGEGVYKAEARRKLMRDLPAAMRPAVELFGWQLDCLEELKGEAEAAMVAESRRHRISRILKTLPGLGEIRVAQLLPIVITPHRFRTKRQFWSYCGLGVVMRSTSDWVQRPGGWVKEQRAQTRGLNRNHNRTLKWLFKGAATTVITHAAPNPFRTAYERMIAEGTKPNLAKVTVARKLSATVLAMWKAEEVYDPKR